MSLEPEPLSRPVVIDTNVLYSMPLADTLLRAAERGLFDFVWTADIMRELRATMLRQGFPADAVDRRVTAIERAFRDTELIGYEDRSPGLQLPDPNDRHVLAAAIHAEARVIVTANAKDFPSDRLAAHAIRALTAADFLADLIREFPQRLLEIVHEQANTMRRPPMTFASLVEKLAAYAPVFSAILRELEAQEHQVSSQEAVSDAPSGEPSAG